MTALETRRTIWDCVRQSLQGSLYGPWATALSHLELETITRGEEESEHYILRTDDERWQQAAARLERRICQELQRLTGYPATLSIVVLPAHVPPPASERESEPEIETEMDDSLVDEIRRSIRHRQGSGHEMAQYGVRNKYWRYYPIGVYESLFWRVYLGNNVCTTWDVLRSHAEGGRPWPSLRRLSMLVSGSAGNTKHLNQWLDILFNEGIVFWQEIDGKRDYSIVRELPLLTPRQVETLPPALQEEHERWLKERKLWRKWCRVRAISFVEPIRDDEARVLHFQRKSA